MKTYPPTIGTDIRVAAKAAIESALAQRAPLVMKFNGVDLSVHPDDHPDTIADNYARFQEERQAAYEASPEGIKAAEIRAEQAREWQQRHDSLIESLPTAAKSMDDLVAWVKDFTEVADMGPVRRNFALVRKIIAEEGYKPGENCKLSAAAYQDRGICGRWIIGQVLSGIDSGWGLHPMLIVFCENYQTLTPTP